MMGFSTNPYVTYHDRNSKEFIKLNKGVMIDFEASEQFEVRPSNEDAFAECMDRTSKLYAYYGYLRQFPTTMTVALYGTVTLGNHANLIETCNRIRLDAVLKNVNMTWGDKSFTDVTHHEIQDMTIARGKVTGGVRGILYDTGKDLFLKRWRSIMMYHHALLLFTDAAKRAVKTHVTTYEHYNPDTVETAYDGPTILSIIFQTIRLNVRVNVFNKIGTMTDVTLASYDDNVVEWITKMEMNQININLRIPGAYENDQFLTDIYSGALLEKCKTFTNEIQYQKHKWLLGALPNSGHINTTNSMIQIYSNII